MLTAYLTATQSLLQVPPAPTTLYTTAVLTTFINSARGQLAGEAECIRFMGSLPLTAGSNSYPFGSIALAGGTSVGIQGVLNVRTAWYLVGTGQKWLRPRPFEWFSLYELNNPAPLPGPPQVWSQFGQGAQAQVSPNPVGGGSLYVSPPPDTAYTVPLDCVCYPIPLVDDTTPEAIPYLWTDAVPYFAAYLALLSAQTGARIQQAQQMYQTYGEFVARGRRAATPSVLPVLYPQIPNPVRQNQLGMAPQRGQAQ
jgi:hypothetical protein